MTQEQIRVASRRAALREACAICDEMTHLILRENPGRRKGTASVAAQFAMDQVQRCADQINALRDATVVLTAAAGEVELERANEDSQRIR